MSNSTSSEYLPPSTFYGQTFSANPNQSAGTVDNDGNISNGLYVSLIDLERRLKSFSNEENVSALKAIDTYPMFFEELLKIVSEDNTYNPDSKEDFIRYHELLFSVVSHLAENIKKYNIPTHLFSIDSSFSKSKLAYIALHIEKYLTPENREMFGFITKQTDVNQILELVINLNSFTARTRNFIENQRKLTPFHIDSFDILKEPRLDLRAVLSFFSIPKEDSFSALEAMLGRVSAPTQAQKETLTSSIISAESEVLSVSEKIQLVQKFDANYLQNKDLFHFLFKNITEYLSPTLTNSQIVSYQKEHENLDNFIKNTFKIDYDFSVGLKNYFQAIIITDENEQRRYPAKEIMSFVEWLIKLKANNFLTEKELLASKGLLRVNTQASDKTPNEYMIKLWDKYLDLFKDVSLTTNELITVLRQYSKVNDTAIKNLTCFDFSESFKKQYEDSENSHFLECLFDADANLFLVFFFYHNYDDLSKSDQTKIAKHFDQKLKNLNSVLHISEETGEVFHSTSQQEVIKAMFLGESQWLGNLVNQMSKASLEPILELNKTEPHALRQHLINNGGVASIENQFWTGIFSHNLKLIQDNVEEGQSIDLVDTSLLKPWQKKNILEVLLRSYVETPQNVKNLNSSKHMQKRLKSNLNGLSTLLDFKLDNLIFEEPIQGCWSLGDFYNAYKLPNKRLLTSEAIISKYFEKNPTSPLIPKNKKFLSLFSKKISVDMDKLRPLINGEISKYYFKDKELQIEYHVAPANELIKEAEISIKPIEATGLGHTLGLILERTQTLIQSPVAENIDLEIKLAIQKSSLLFMEMLQFCKAAEDFLPLNQKIEAKQLFGHFEESVEKYQNVIKKINLLDHAQVEGGFLKSMLKNTSNLKEDAQNANVQILKHLTLLNENAQSLKQSMEVAITNTDLKELMVQGQFLENKFGKTNTIEVSPDILPEPVEKITKPILKTMTASRG